LSRQFTGVLNGQQPGNVDIGGWTLSDEHVFDITSNQVTLGNGVTYQLGQKSPTIFDLVGDGSMGPPGVGADPLETGIREVLDFDIRPDGALHFTYNGAFYDDYIVSLGVNASIQSGTFNGAMPDQIVTDGPGRTYYSNLPPDYDAAYPDTTGLCASIIRVEADGSETHVAGNASYHPGVSSNHYRGSPFAPCIRPIDLELGSDGTLYMALDWTTEDPNGADPQTEQVIASLAPNGVLSVLAGGGPQIPDFADSNGNPQPDKIYNGLDIKFISGMDGQSITDIALDSKGNIYLMDIHLFRLMKLRPDGMIKWIAGNGHLPIPLTYPNSLSEAPAKSSPIGFVDALAVDSRDRLYFASATNGYSSNDPDSGGFVSRAIYYVENDTIKHYAGSENEMAGAVYGVDGESLGKDILYITEMKFGPDDILYFYEKNGIFDFENAGGKIRAVGPPQIKFENQNYRVPSKDGSLVYTFNERGLHLKTEDSVTGVVLKEFVRDADGALIAIENKVTGARTTIDRTSSPGQIIIEGLPPGVQAGNGFSYILDFDAAGMLDSVTRPDGLSNSLDYDSAGLLTKMIDFGGDTHSYYYDSVGHLTLDDKPVGSLNLTDGDGTLPGDITVDITTAEGLTTHYSVDNPQSELSSRTIEYPDGSQTRIYHPTATNGLCKYTPPGSSEVEHRQCRYIEARDGMHTELHFGPDPRPDFAPTVRHVTRSIETVPKFIDPANDAKKLSRLVEVDLSTDAQMSTGEMVTWKEEITTYRDYDGDPDSADRLSVVWQRGHNANPTHATAAYSWISVSPAGRKSEAFYNSDGRLIEVDPPGPTRTVYHYDTQTKRLNSIELKNDAGQSRITNFTYDSKGRIETVMAPGMMGKRYNFPDEVGSPLEMVGLPESIEQLDATMSTVRQVNFDWDEVGNLIGIETPPDLQRHGMTFTPDGSLNTYTTPSAGGTSHTTDFDYDLDGRLKYIMRDGLETKQYWYGIDGRVNFVDELGSSIQRSYGYYLYDYDQTSQLRRMGISGYYEYDFESIIRFDWNGSLLTSIQHDYRSGWHNFDHLVTRTYHDGDLSLKSRKVDDLNGSSCPLGCAVEFDYTLDGLLDEAGPMYIVRDPITGRIKETAVRYWISGPAYNTDQTITDYGYNDFGEPKSLFYYNRKLGPIARFEINQRDDLGRILQSTETIGDDPSTTYNYQYSPEGYLEKVWINADPATDPATYSYTYDANGNRTTVVQNLTGAYNRWDATFDAQDRLLTFECRDKLWSTFGYFIFFDPCTNSGDYPIHTVTYSSYDGSAMRQGPGGHANGDDWEYSYDASNNLLRMELLNSTDNPIDYQINALDQRVAKHRQNEFYPEDGKHWLWSVDGQLLAAFNDDGDIIRRFIYATRSHVPDMMYAKVDGTWILYRFVTDWRGSVRLVVNAWTGYVAQRIDYTPFGRVLQDTKPGFQPFGFAGGLYDYETGLVRFGARDYNPLIGRWTSKDPILFGGGDTNLYRYVGNDPVNFIDPSGLQSMVVRQVPFYPVGGGGVRGLAGRVGVITAGTGYGALAIWVAEKAPDYIANPDGGVCEVPDIPNYTNPDIAPPGFDDRVNPKANYPYPFPEKGYVRPDLDHAPPIGPHWDWEDPFGGEWRIYPGGVPVPKSMFFAPIPIHPLY
jgi:RHS repeat-associated protein